MTEIAKTPLILCTTSSFGPDDSEPRLALGRAGLRLVLNPHGRKLTEDELASLLAEHRPIGLLAGTEPITRRALENARDHLRVVSRIGVGWDNVDHAAAAELGIKVCRTEGVLDASVAELTLAFILSALRHLPAHDRDIRAGVWKKRMGGLLAGKAVGLVGFGAIGMRVASLVRAFGAVVLFCDLAERDDCGCTPCDLSALLPQADIVSLHASGSGCILGQEELSLLKPGAILVNTARGGLIDEEALRQALISGRVGAACLDVFEREPYTGPLAGLPNVILTPHIGSYALEARNLMEVAAVEHLLGGLAEAGCL
jgi:D-3-phosphoglycerate dehydrogenase